MRWLPGVKARTLLGSTPALAGLQNWRSMVISDWTRDTSLCPCKTNPRLPPKGKRWAVVQFCLGCRCHDWSQDPKFPGVSWEGESTRQGVRALKSIPSLGVERTCRGNYGEMRSYAWALIPHNWYPYRKRRLRHRHRPRGDHVRL